MRLSPLPALHGLSGRVFRYVSAHYPEPHPLRIRVERGLQKFYGWEARRDPGNADAHGKLGSLLANIGQHEAAAASFARALQCDHPEPAKIHYFMGRERMRQGDATAATECYRSFVQLAARNVGVPARAAEDWSRLEQDASYRPERFHGYLHLALKCLDAGLPEAARELLRTSIILEPLVIPAHKLLSDLLWDSGEREAALHAAHQGHYFQLQRAAPGVSVASARRDESRAPDFMILGKMRCGTTSLYDYLVQHPGVCPALAKELHFFTEHYDRGLQWYRAQFPAVKSRAGCLVGEASADYIDSPAAADRIQRHFPATRFIVLLRDPVERTVSHYYYRRQRGQESRGIEEALLAGLDSGSGNAWSTYIECSVYVRALREWLDRFPREQFLVLQSERLFEAPATVTGQAVAFLGLPPRADLDCRVRNRGVGANVDDALVARLRDFFRPHNRDLERFLGMRFDWGE